MAYDYNGTNQYVSANASPLGTGQLGDHTIAFWVKGSAASPTTTVFSISRSTETSGVNNPAILVQNDNGAVRYFLRGNSSSTGNAWNTASGISGGVAFDNTAHHVCVRLSSTTSTIYVDGSSVASNTAGSVSIQTGMDRLGIGALVRGNVVTYYSGSVAEVGVWNFALTVAEIVSLSKGMICSRIKPQNIVFHAPLVRNLQDIKRGLALTNNNGATVVNHPRVY